MLSTEMVSYLSMVRAMTLKMLEAMKVLRIINSKWA